MLSGSRGCLSIKKQSCTVRKQQLNEPLLFLYPRWFQTAAITRRPTCSDLSQTDFREISGSTTSTRPARRAWTDCGQFAPPARPDAPGVDIGSPSQNGNTDIPPKSQAILASARDLWRGSESASRPHNNMTTSQRESDLIPTTSPSKPPSSTDLTSAKHTKGVQHHTEKLRIWRTHQSAYRQVLAKSPESNAKSIKKEATRTLHDPVGIEWSVPIRLLAQLIHRPKEVLGERLELHRNTVHRLTGSVDANAWFHQVGWGCEVRVLEERARDRNKVVVALHGMTRARRLTREYLLEADRDVVESAPWHLSPKDDSARILFVLSSLKWHLRTRDVRRADKVEYPQSWTVRSFADVIETLTTMQIPRQLRRELYEGTETHNHAVARVIESLFSDPRSTPYISSRALNAALNFTCKHTEIVDTSNFLFQKAKSIGLSLQADTFNILMEESLRQNKLSHYQSLLADMRRMGIVPNGMTWLALLRVTKSRTGHRAILQHLRQKWPKDSMVWQQVALELISNDFAKHVRLEKSFYYFVDFMDQSLPSAWLSARCINRMLMVCAKHKLWDIVPRIVEFGERRGGYFNTATQTRLLSVFQKRGSIRDSIDLLESDFAKTVGRDSAFAIPTVFITAWNNRFYNVCRVLWRYAAVNGIITSTMQNVVTLSLTKNNDESSDSGSHLWRMTAGKVIAGMDLKTPDLGAGYRFLSKEGLRDPMKVLAQWTPDDGPRQEQLALAVTIIQRDLTAYKRFWHFRSEQLFDLLRKAYEMDCDWMHNKKVRRYSDLSWMIESAIEVPLQPLADTSISPRHLL